MNCWKIVQFSKNGEKGIQIRHFQMSMLQAGLTILLAYEGQNLKKKTHLLVCWILKRVFAMHAVTTLLFKIAVWLFFVEKNMQQPILSTVAGCSMYNLEVKRGIFR